MHKPEQRTYEYNKEYVKKYMEKLGEIRLRMPRAQKAHIVDAAQKAGESVNQYVLKSVQERMEREK